MTDSQAERQAVAIGTREELRARALEFVNAYRHGTDDAPYFVAMDIARLAPPYAIALTAAVCEQLDEYERPRFAALLFTVARGRYRSVFDEASE